MFIPTPIIATVIGVIVAFYIERFRTRKDPEITITYLGYCKNCYHDIVKGDHMDCCGNLDLVETNHDT